LRVNVVREAAYSAMPFEHEYLFACLGENGSSGQPA
jgi:hypothetical protein